MLIADMEANIWSVLAAIVMMLTGGGLAKLLDWLSDRRKARQEASTQQRLDMVKEYSSFLGELRGEIHTLRDRLNVALLRVEELQGELAAEKIKTQTLEERLNILTSSGGVAQITADQAGRVMAWSPVATDLFGWSAVEAIGKQLEDLIIPPEYAEVHKTAIASCAAEDRPPRSTALIFRAHDKWKKAMLVDVTLSGEKAGDKWFYSATVRRRAERFN